MEAAKPVTPQKEKKPGIISRIMDNPVIAKEFTSRMRGNQAFILLLVYLCLISGIIIMIYTTTASVGSGVSWDPSFPQGLGKAVFSTVIIMELLLISFIGPGLTAGAITSEREHQTFDLLRTTLLSARSLIFGKLGTAFAFLLLLIVTALPIEGFAFYLGGVEIGEVLVSLLMLIVTALANCALGIFFSSIMKRTLTATISSYGAILFSIIMMVISLFLLATNSLYQDSPVTETAYMVFLWFLISTNPILAAVFTEILLVDSQSFFYAKSPLGLGTTTSNLYLPSPWIIYVISYMLFTIILVTISIYVINKPDK